MFLYCKIENLLCIRLSTEIALLIESHTNYGKIPWLSSNYKILDSLRSIESFRAFRGGRMI